VNECKPLPTGGGKSMCFKSLSRAMTKLNKEGSEFYQKTKYVCLNPKSITMGQLYGDFDEATHEWTDGRGLHSSTFHLNQSLFSH
jgi:dynein heavy chain